MNLKHNSSNQKTCPENPICVSNAQAARLLGLSPQTLANWRCKGKGPKPTHCGRRVVYQVDELRRYAEEHTRR